MLAHYVCEIFEDDLLANKLSENARKHALVIHNKETNLNRTLEIYDQIIKQDKGSV
jgi:hypothetical protein